MATQSNVIENQTFIWTQYYEEVDKYPLMNSFNLIVALDILYLALVLKILPDFMKNKEPYKLKKTIILFNAMEVIASTYFVYLGIELLWTYGLLPATPAEFNFECRQKMLFFIYIYFLSKISELLDTIFFVLKKKYNQVSFLHVYHHAATMVGTWLMVRYSLTQSYVYSATINSAVHVVMYFYYAIAAMGPQYAKYLTWKKHITTFQLVQFVSMFVHHIMTLAFTRGPHTVIGSVYILFSSAFFFYLFFDFFKKSYQKPKKDASEISGEKVKAS